MEEGADYRHSATPRASRAQNAFEAEELNAALAQKRAQGLELGENAFDLPAFVSREPARLLLLSRREVCVCLFYCC